jgi:hypothetical protein
MDIVEELEKGCGCYADGSTSADLESHHCVRCRAAAELTRLRSDNERMREALETFDKQAAVIGGCSDGYCSVTGRARGMHTNGGCKCSFDRHRASRAMINGRRLADAIRSALSQRQGEG